MVARTDGAGYVRSIDGMHRTLVCASSCIKHVQPSYGCLGMPIVARMCLYCGKNYLIHNLITEKYWNKNEKHIFK